MEQKEIILISPNPSFPGNSVWRCNLPSLPLNIMSLVPLLEKNGFKVKMVDTREQDYVQIKYENALFVGISTQTGVQIKNGIEVANYIRENYPTIPIVWGGIHPSLTPEETARHPLVDIVCRGEGEDTIVDLAKVLIDGYDINSVSGLTYKNNNGEIINTSSRPFLDMESLDHLPFEKLNMKKYGYKVEMFSSRGCPNKCTFCYNLSYHHSKWRSKSADKVIDEMEHAEKTVNPPGIVNFCDDNFFVSQKRVIDICKGKIKKNIDFEWTAFCRADYFRKYSEDFIELLVKSGCSIIDFGGESGSDRMLEIFNKSISSNDLISAAKKCDSMGIEARFSFIFGFKEETENDRKATFNLIDRLIKECKKIGIYGIYILTPYPGTSILEEAIRDGLNYPKSLEEWGEFKFANFDNIPWINEGEISFLRTISRLTRFKFYPQAHSHPYPTTWKNFLYDLLSINSKIRWKLKYFNFPYEWLFYDHHCRRRHKY